MANSAIVGTLKVLLTANTAEFETAMKGVGRDLSALGAQSGIVGGLVGKIGPQLVAAFSIGAIAKVAGDFVTMADALVDLSAKTGLSVTALQRLKGATEQSGVGLDSVANASLQLSKRLGEGNDSTVGALTALGLQYQAIRALSPEDQFFAVADALGKVGDQNVKVALTNDLLGKQGTVILPALNGKLKETADAYEKLGLVMKEDVIRAGADLDEQWTVLKSIGAALIAQALGPMLPVLTDLTKGLIAVGTYLAPLAKGFLTAFGAPVQLAIQSVNYLSAALDLMLGKAAKLPDVRAGAENKVLGPKLEAPTPGGPPTLDPDEMKRIDAELTASAKQRISATTAAEKTGVEDRTRDLRTFYNWLGEREIEDVAREQQALERKEAQWRDYYNWLGERRMEDDAAAEASRLQQEFAASATFQTLFNQGLPAAVQEVRATAGPNLGKAFVGGIGEVFRTDLGPTIMAAVAGGGNVWQSIGSMLGGSLTQGLTDVLKGAFPKFMEGMLGQTLGAFLPGIGALLGPLLDKLFGGPSKEVLAARTTLEGFQTDLRGALTEQQKLEAGGEGWKMDVIAVRDAYLATGRTADEAMAIVRQLWDTDHPDRSRAAIEEINRVLEEQGRIAADNEAAAEAATRAQEEAAAARAAELEDLQGRLRDLKEEAEVDWNDMAEAAKRYGVDLDSLGPKFQDQRIGATAQDIISTFDMLTENGASVGGVLFGMREEITAFVQDSLRFGREVPANMRPWIEELQRSGNLVDENGNALTDLSQLRFGAPVESQLDRVNRELEDLTARIEELTAQIAVDLVAAFEKIPERITVEFDLRFPENPPENILRPFTPPTGLAAGGIVTAPTLALIGEGHQPEAVIPLDRLRDHGTGGGIVVLPFIPITDPYAAAEEGARQFARRVAGDSHGMREVLEQVIDDWMRTYSPVTT